MIARIVVSLFEMSVLHGWERGDFGFLAWNLLINTGG
jgi:hypothetical protein